MANVVPVVTIRQRTTLDVDSTFTSPGSLDLFAVGAEGSPRSRILPIRPANYGHTAGGDRKTLWAPTLSSDRRLIRMDVDTSE